MKKLFLMLVVIGLLFTACSNAGKTRAFLESQGYTNIETTGFDFFAHGKDDMTTTGFTATAPSGKQVKGAVSDKGPFCFFRPRMNIRIWETY